METAIPQSGADSLGVSSVERKRMRRAEASHIGKERSGAQTGLRPSQEWL